MSTLAVVPIYRWPLSSWEAGCLATLLQDPPGDVVAVAPEGLRTPGLGLPVSTFSPAYFQSRDHYSRFMVSLDFYDRFADTEWLLIFQTDAVWLGGSLAALQGGTADYLGAPWLRTRGVPSSGFSRVGNGGLSLRRVRRFLEVLRGGTVAASFLDIFRCIAAPDLESLPVLDRFLKSLRLWRAARRGVEAFAAHYTLNEDHFWSDRATIFDRDFKVASVEEGLKFAFEEAPRLAFEMNGRQLPLGAHAWQLHDPDFWYEKVPGLPGRRAP